MASNYTPSTVGPGVASMEQINNEFQKIKTAMDRLVSRYPDAPNAMQFPLDLGGQDIINVGKITAVDLEVGGIDLAYQIQAAQDAADEAAGYASAAQAAAASAQGYANTAEAALDNIRYAQVEERASSFSVSDADTLKILVYTGTSAGTVTLPSGVTTGVQLVVIQGDAGAVTFDAGAQTLLSANGATTTVGPGAPATLIKLPSGWFLGGQVE